MVSFERDSGIRPVHQQQVDVVDAEIGEALVDRAREIVRRADIRANFGAQKDVVTRGTPEARMPSPTPRSVPYFQAVSMWR